MKCLPCADATLVVLVNQLSSDRSDMQAGEKIFTGLADTLFPGRVPAWYVRLIDPPDASNAQ
ncbi:MAG: hypothetical protein WCP98_22780 [Actinomycetes bacterium]